MTLKQEGINKRQTKFVFWCQISVLNLKKRGQDFVQKSKCEIPKKGSPLSLLFFDIFSSIN